MLVLPHDCDLIDFIIYSGDVFHTVVHVIRCLIFELLNLILCTDNDDDM